MLNFFKNTEKRPAEPLAPNTLGQQDMVFRIQVLEARVINLEQCILTLCEGLKQQVARLDQQDNVLDANMHNLATLTIRPPKDLLGGQEAN